MALVMYFIMRNDYFIFTVAFLFQPMRRINEESEDTLRKHTFGETETQASRNEKSFSAELHKLSILPSSMFTPFE